MVDSTPDTASLAVSWTSTPATAHPPASTRRPVSDAVSPRYMGNVECTSGLSWKSFSLVASGACTTAVACWPVCHDEMKSASVSPGAISRMGSPGLPLP